MKSSDDLTSKWELWLKETDKRKKQQLLADLLDDCEEVIKPKLLQFERGAQVTPELVSASAMPLILKAIHTYNPKRGASLSTYINLHLKHLRREIADIQNIGRIPESRSLKIPEYKAVVAELTDKLGREPNIDEIANALQWPHKEVARLQAELTADIPIYASMETEMGFQDIILSNDSPVVSEILYHDLGPEEKFVFEHTVGFAGAPIYDVETIAKKLNKKPADIYRIRNKIGKKLAEYKYSKLPRTHLMPDVLPPAVGQKDLWSKVGDFFD